MDSDRAYQYELPMNRSLHAYACEGAHFLYVPNGAKQIQIASAQYRYCPLTGLH
jgi:hypothetical protein